jgi:hypothetical protein
MLNGALHAPPAAAQCSNILIEIEEPHVVELAELLGVALLGRPVIRWHRSLGGEDSCHQEDLRG